MSDDKPIKSVLYICNMNQIRSPMAEFLTKDLFGSEIYAQSAGIYEGDEDGFMQAVMQERGIDVSEHVPEALRDLEDTNVDLVITLTDQAKDDVADFFKQQPVLIEHWPIDNPSIALGKRDVVLDAYRQTREELEKLIKQRFS